LKGRWRRMRQRRSLVCPRKICCFFSASVGRRLFWVVLHSWCWIFLSLAY
jgi:hypothetical protein